MAMPISSTAASNALNSSDVRVLRREDGPLTPKQRRTHAPIVVFGIWDGLAPLVGILLAAYLGLPVPLSLDNVGRRHQSRPAGRLALARSFAVRGDDGTHDDR